MRALRLFRLATAIITLAVVVALIWFAPESGAARAIAAGVLALGALQWWALGRMGRKYDP